MVSEYKVLQQQKQYYGDCSIVPIRFQDRMEIRKWRNEQIYHLRQENPLTVEDQDNYFLNIVNNLFEQEWPKQILFSFLEKNICIGYGGLVHINWIDQNAELSFILDTKLESEFFSYYLSSFLKLIEKVAFQELNLHKIYSYAFDIRPHLYPILESEGFVKDAVLKEHCFFNQEFKNVVIHFKINGNPIK